MERIFDSEHAELVPALWWDVLVLTQLWCLPI